MKMVGPEGQRDRGRWNKKTSLVSGLGLQLLFCVFL